MCGVLDCWRRGGDLRERWHGLIIRINSVLNGLSLSSSIVAEDFVPWVVQSTSVASWSNANQEISHYVFLLNGEQ